MESVDDKDFCDLLRLIASKPGGLAVAIKILEMRCHSNTKTEELATDAMKSTGQELLTQLSFDRDTNRSDDTDYGLGKIIEIFFSNDKAKANAEILCKNLSQAFSEHRTSPIYYKNVLEALATTQPIVFLDVFLGDPVAREHLMFFSQDRDYAPNPLSKIPEDRILAWCDTDPAVRYPTVAACIIPYGSAGQDKRLEWTPLASLIITKAPDSITILNELKRSFRPMSWEGSRAEIMQRRLSLILNLKNHANSSIGEWARKEEKEFEDAIRSERQRETQREQVENERFE